MAIKKTVIIDVQTGDAVKNVDNLKKATDNLTTSTEKLSDSTGQMGEALDGATGGALGKFNSLRGGVTKLITSFKSLRVAIIGTGIGALLIGILAVKEAFTSSEAGQNKFAKLMGVIGSVIGNLTDLLADLGEGIISVFENPKAAINSFVELLKNQVINRLNGLLELIPAIGKAMSLTFKGQFSEAAEVAANAMGKVVLGVDNVTESIALAGQALADFQAEVIADAEIAAEIADKRAEAIKLERELIVETAEAKLEINELLLESEDSLNYSTEERIALLEEAQQIDEDITDKTIEAARLRYEAQKLENTLSKSTIEDLEEEEQLKADLIDLEADRLSRAKETSTKIIGLTTQENAAKQKAWDDEKKRIKEREKLTREAFDKIDGVIYGERNAREEADRELDILDRQRSANEIENGRERLAAKLRLLEEEKTYETERLEAIATNSNNEVEVTAAAWEEIYALRNQFYEDSKDLIAEYNADRNLTRDEQIAAEIESETKLAAAKTALQVEQIEAVRQGFFALGQLAEDNKTVQAIALIGQAAASIASTVIKTQAANAIIVAEGAALAIPTFGASVAAATALVTANNISAGISIGLQGLALGTGLAALGKSGSGGAATQAPPTATAPVAAPAPPQFNTVGASDVNQLNQTVNAQGSQPVKAYVVSTDMTSQQQLDRNIEGQATFG